MDINALTIEEYTELTELWQEATNKGITDVTREETVVMIMRALKQSK